MKYTNVKIKELKNSEVEITAEVAAESLEVAKSAVIKDLSKNAKIDGFRKGHIPAEIIKKNFSEAYILDKASQELVSAVYPMIITEHNIKAIGQPVVQIKKLADGNPMEFSATTSVMPEIKLPDYKKIAKKVFTKKEKIEVTKKDVEDVLTNIKRQRVQIEQIEKQKKEGVDKPKVSDVKDEDLKELDDEFVKTLGDFKDVDDFKKKIEENIKTEKELKAVEKQRIEAIESIVDKSKVEIPAILAEYELDRIQAQFEADVSQAGTRLDDYLKQIDKTMDDLRSDWRDDAEKRAKLQLVLNKLADENNIYPDEEKLNKEVQYILAQHKDAKEENVRVYVETTMRNETVLEFLEVVK